MSTSNTIPLHTLTADVLITGGVTGAIVVGTAAVEAVVGASAILRRKSLTIYNASDASIYWGFGSDVTTASGIVIYPEEVIHFAVAEACQIWLVAASGGLDVRISEGA